ncbi:transposase [Streptomyces sp. NPDC088748]|uniref:IS110 family transposase n=1 Tax=Streptomyces sp. NPDC088748 TaxID=3365887 RepID=UPI0037F63F4C
MSLHVIDIGDIDAFLGKGETPRPYRHPGWEECLRQAAAQHRTPAPPALLELKAKHGTMLIVVDQPASIDALLLSVAHNLRCPAAYLPGLPMRRIANLHPCGAKTDPKGACIIADAARVPHRLRAIDGKDETIAELEMTVGFDDDLAGPGHDPSLRPASPGPPAAGTGPGNGLQHPAVLTLLGSSGWSRTSSPPWTSGSPPFPAPRRPH